MPPPSASLSGTRARSILLVFAVFVFFFAAYVLTASGDIFSTGDTTIRIELAENIVGRAGVNLNGWIYKVPLHYKQEFLDPRIDVGRHGLTYTTYLLGQPLAIIPFDLAGSRLAVLERWPFGPTVLFVDRLVGPLFGALEAAIFFLFAVRLGYGLSRSVLLTLLLGFATIVWPDEQSVLEHGEVAFFLLLGMYFAFRYRENGRGPLYLVLCGAAVGGAAITRYQDAAIGTAAIALYLILPGGVPGIWERVRRLALAGLGLLPFLLIDAWYTWIRFGSLTATGHHERVFGYPIWLGVAGLLVSPGKGLLWYCPTIVLLLFAAPPFMRRFPALSVAIAALAAGFILLYGYVTYWHGDPAWGPRYITPIVPFLTLPLGTLFTLRVRGAVAIRVVAVLVVLAGLTVQLSAVSVSQWRSWYRVISYEENQGHTWVWIAARYRYFWNVHESPLDFQLRGLYQLAYDSVRDSNKYVIVPPSEDPILDGITNDYSINSWSFWWADNELNWWMGEDKVVAAAAMLVAVMLAAGTYVTAESMGVFRRPAARTAQPEPVPEAA